MKYVKLGNSGVDVSRICLGMMSFGKPGTENGVFPWALPFDDAKPLFRKAVELGINFFDTANVYPLGSDHRLKRLGLDYVDLYQIHRLDAFTPMEEIMEALHDVVKSGKARYIGACTMDAWQFERLQNISERNGWTKFITMQNQYNLIYREEEHEMMPLCLDRKVGVNPWSPLAGGRCAHSWGTQTARTKIDAVSPMVWTDKTAEQDKAVVDNLEKVAREHGRTMAQESLAWMLSKPFICSPVVGWVKVIFVAWSMSRSPSSHFP